MEGLKTGATATAAGSLGRKQQSRPQKLRQRRWWLPASGGLLTSAEAGKTRHVAAQQEDEGRRLVSARSQQAPRIRPKVLELGISSGMIATTRAAVSVTDTSMSVAHAASAAD